MAKYRMSVLYFPSGQEQGKPAYNYHPLVAESPSGSEHIRVAIVSMNHADAPGVAPAGSHAQKTGDLQEAFLMTLAVLNSHHVGLKKRAGDIVEDKPR